MKRLILSVLIAITAFAAHAQHDYFDKYADMEGVTSVYVSKAMFKFIQGLPIETVEFLDDTAHVHIVALNG